MPAPFGSGGGAVEVDETYFGTKEGRRGAKAGTAHKFGVLALVDRETGTMRSFTFDKFRADEVHPIVLNWRKQAFPSIVTPDLIRGP